MVQRSTFSALVTISLLVKVKPYLVNSAGPKKWFDQLIVFILDEISEEFIAKKLRQSCGGLWWLQPHQMRFFYGRIVVQRSTSTGSMAVCSLVKLNYNGANSVEPGNVTDVANWRLPSWCENSNVSVFSWQRSQKFHHLHHTLL